MILAIAITPVLAGKLDDGLGQLIFVFPMRRSVAACAAVIDLPIGTPPALPDQCFLLCHGTPL